MPEEEKKMVDIDTSGPGADISIEEKKDEAVIEQPEQETENTEQTISKITVLVGLGARSLEMGSQAWNRGYAEVSRCAMGGHDREAQIRQDSCYDDSENKPVQYPISYPRRIPRRT